MSSAASAAVAAMVGPRERTPSFKAVEGKKPTKAARKRARAQRAKAVVQEETDEPSEKKAKPANTTLAQGQEEDEEEDDEEGQETTEALIERPQSEVTEQKVVVTHWSDLAANMMEQMHCLLQRARFYKLESTLLQRQVRQLGHEPDLDFVTEDITSSDGCEHHRPEGYESPWDTYERLGAFPGSEEERIGAVARDVTEKCQGIRDEHDKAWTTRIEERCEYHKEHKVYAPTGWTDVDNKGVFVAPKKQPARSLAPPRSSLGSYAARPKEPSSESKTLARSSKSPGRDTGDASGEEDDEKNDTSSTDTNLTSMYLNTSHPASGTKVLMDRMGYREKAIRMRVYARLGLFRRLEGRIATARMLEGQITLPQQHRHQQSSQTGRDIVQVKNVDALDMAWAIDSVTNWSACMREYTSETSILLGSEVALTWSKYNDFIQQRASGSDWNEVLKLDTLIRMAMAAHYKLHNRPLLFAETSPAFVELIQQWTMAKYEAMEVSGGRKMTATNSTWSERSPRSRNRSTTTAAGATRNAAQKEAQSCRAVEVYIPAGDRSRTSVKPCFDFNKDTGCSRMNCRFDHVCAKCRGKHSETACKKPAAAPM